MSYPALRQLVLIMIFCLMPLHYGEAAYSSQGALPTNYPSSSSNSSSQSPSSPGSHVEPFVSYSREDFRWSIGNQAIKPNYPNIASELIWKNLHVLKIGVSGIGDFGNSIVLEGAASYGFILKGKNQDSDFGGNDRTKEWSRATLKTKGHTLDLSLGGGMKISVTSDSTITPLLGVSYQEKTFSDSNLYQNITHTNLAPPSFWTDHNITPNQYPAAGTRQNGHINTYKASFYGPWIGFNSEIKMSSNWTLLTSLKGRYVWYKGQGNWPNNLNFTHTSKGFGVSGQVGVSYDVLKNLGISGIVGGDYIKINKGNQDSTKDYYRGATFKAVQVSLGARYKF
jgi:hypothetical protein